MNCSEIEVYVSSIYDGEQIPEGVAEHIAGCGFCRQTLNDYSRMGAELRLAATMESTRLPALRLPARESRRAFLWRRVAVPLFALAGLIACLIAAIAATSIVRAQSNALWFEFGYSMGEGDPFNYLVAKAGFDQTPASLGFIHGQPLAAALRLKVKSISKDDVVLQVRAVPARIEATAGEVKLLGGPIGGVSLDGVPNVHYKPGESLPIQVEGGGTLYLKGDVLDHQSKIAFGTPLVPPEDKMIIRSPALFDSNTLVGQFMGASTTANGSEVAFLSVPEGVFSFGLKPFPGAVQGEANWGEITFRLDGKDYRLLAAAPITGGDQPRLVWVRHNVQSDWPQHCDQGCIGSTSVTK